MLTYADVYEQTLVCGGGEVVDVLAVGVQGVRLCQRLWLGPSLEVLSISVLSQYELLLLVASSHSGRGGEGGGGGGSRCGGGGAVAGGAGQATQGTRGVAFIVERNLNHDVLRERLGEREAEDNGCGGWGVESRLAVDVDYLTCLTAILRARAA
jgi:hypothetical protein